MAAGIVAKDEAQHVAQEAALLREQIAAREEQISALSVRVAEMEAEAGMAVAGTELAKNAKLPAVLSVLRKGTLPPMTSHEEEAAKLGAIAILAKSGHHTASRAFWKAELERLGVHLKPHASPSEQEHAALADPRGHDIIGAIHRTIS